MNAWLSDRKDVLVLQPLWAGPGSEWGHRTPAPPRPRPRPPGRLTGKSRAGGPGSGLPVPERGGRWRTSAPFSDPKGTSKTRRTWCHNSEKKWEVPSEAAAAQTPAPGGHRCGPGVCRPGGRRKQTKVASEALCAAAFLKKGKTRGLKRKKKKETGRKRKRKKRREGGRREGRGRKKKNLY